MDETLLTHIAGQHFERVRRTLAGLAANAPQTLLLEGGIEEERLECALYWGLTANCASALAKMARGEAAEPCLACSTCRQFAANENLDLLIYDGRISNKQDEDKPGPVRALRIENIRELKAALASRPHGDGKRIVLLQGMSQTREEAMNSLLKILEEPCAHTLFVLLASQRMQILPTLVSRSFCITLPWPDCGAQNEEISEWELALASFLAGGTGFLDKLSAKGALDAQLASQLILSCQRSIVRVLGGQDNSRRGHLDKILMPLAKNLAGAALAGRWLDEAQGMLLATVSPQRVLEALFSRIYLLLRQHP